MATASQLLTALKAKTTAGTPAYQAIQKVQDIRAVNQAKQVLSSSSSNLQQKVAAAITISADRPSNLPVTYTTQKINQVMPAHDLTTGGSPAAVDAADTALRFIFPPYSLIKSLMDLPSDQQDTALSAISPAYAAKNLVSKYPDMAGLFFPPASLVTGLPGTAAVAESTGAGSIWSNSVVKLGILAIAGIGGIYLLGKFLSRGKK